jgi:hypothetical protein
MKILIKKIIKIDMMTQNMKGGKKIIKGIIKEMITENIMIININFFIS